MSDQPENASLPHVRDGARLDAVLQSPQREAQREPPSHTPGTPLTDSMDGTPYSEQQALRSAVEALRLAEDHDDDRTLHQPETPPRARVREPVPETRAQVDTSTANVYDLKLHQKPSRTDQGVVDHSTAPPRRAHPSGGIIFRTPRNSPTKNNEKTNYNGAKTNGFVRNTSTSKDKDDNRLVASVSDGQARKSKVKSDDGAKTNGFSSDNDDNGVVVRVAVARAPTSKDKDNRGAKTYCFARHASIFSNKGDDGAVASVSSGHAHKSMDKDVDDADIDGYAGTASTFSDKDEDGAVTSISAGHALSDKDHDVAETSGIAGPISMPYDKDDDGAVTAVTSGSSGHVHGFDGKHDDGAEPTSFAGHASLNDHDGAETSGFAGHASTMNNENEEDAETGGVVKHARSLLAVLSTVCTFGASPTFSSLYGDLKHTAHPSFIAWSFASFAIGIVVTLVWQAALISDFRGFTGRLYRSELGIVVALAIGFAAITSGTVFLSLSLAVDKNPGVRAAGFTVIGVVGFLFCCSLIRLAFTVVRRARKHSGAEETAPPV